MRPFPSTQVRVPPVLTAALMAAVMLVGAAGCRNECGDGMERRDGRCVTVCNSEADCKRTESCRDGMCTEAAGSTSSGGVGASSASGASSSSSSPASASSGVTASSSVGGSSLASSAAVSSASRGSSSSAVGASSSSLAAAASSSTAWSSSSAAVASSTSSSSSGPASFASSSSASSGPADGGMPGDPDQPCAAGACGGGLTCDYSLLVGGVLNQTARVCHTACTYGAAADSCGVGTQCLPSLTTLQGARYNLQADGVGAAVPCSLDGGTACNAAAGFSCHVFAMGTLCGRLAGACGTPVAPFDLTPTAPRSALEFCNTGSPAAVPGSSLLVPGSQFCDPLGALARPPWVFCEPLAGTTVGTCTAACAMPEADGGVDQRDCPAGYNCALDVSSIYRAATPYVGCVDATSCTGGEACAGPFPVADGGMLCARRWGVCQPL